MFSTLTDLFSTDLLLALAKITTILVLAFVVSPFLRHPSHRATLWSLTLISLPIVCLLSLHVSNLRILPNPLLATEERTVTSNIAVAEPVSLETSPLDTSEVVLEKSSPPLEPIIIPTAKGLETKSEKTPFPWLLVVFISGILLSLTPWLISTVKLFLLPKSPATDPPLSFWKKIHQLGKRRNHRTPTLKFTPSPSAPFTYGLIKPKVLIPHDSTDWTPRRIQSTLLHEAAHLRRRDPLVRFLATLARAFFWFHPLVWLAHRQLIQSQEQTCDLHALSHGIAPDDYAEDLLASATHSHLTPSEALSMARWSQLGNRIRLILNPKKPTTMKSNILLTTLTLTVTAGLASLGFAKPTAPKKDAEKNATNSIAKIVIPSIDFQNCSLQEATDFLRVISQGVEDGKPINYVLHLSPKFDQKIDSLKLKDIPHDALLKFIAEKTGTKYYYEKHTILFSDLAVRPTQETNLIAKHGKDLHKKATQITLPTLDFQDTTLAEAIEFLRFRSADLDPEKKGFNFVIRNNNAKLIPGLLLHNASIDTILRYIALLTETQIEYTKQAIVISPMKKKASKFINDETEKILTNIETLHQQGLSSKHPEVVKNIKKLPELKVEVFKDGSMKWSYGGTLKQLDENTLETTLKRIMKLNPGQRVHIQSFPDTPYKYLLNAMNQLDDLNYKNVVYTFSRKTKPNNSNPNK